MGDIRLARPHPFTCRISTRGSYRTGIEFRTVSSSEWSAGKLSRDEASELSVRDVMYASPKTLPADTTVGELRRQFEQPKLRTALLADGSTFVGAIQRADVPASAASEEQAIVYAQRRPEAIGPERPAAEALARSDGENDDYRLVVLADDGQTLIGLVCMNAARTHFCVDKRGTQAVVP